VRVWIRKRKVQMFVPLRAKTQIAPPCRSRCIMVCGSKTCCRKGGDELLERLKEEARARGDNAIRVKRCGCLKNCEEGPSVKMQGVGVQPLHVADLDQFLERHFPTQN